MAGRIVKRVLDYAPDDLTDAELLVLIALAEDARDGDYIARYSSVDVLAGRARRAPGTVKNALSTLVRRGLIQPMHQAHRGKVQHYQLAQLQPYHRTATANRKDPA